jgi:hypothetical protein
MALSKFHDAFDTCMRNDLTWNSHLNRDIRAAIAASRGSEKFKAWTQCYQRYVSSEEQRKQSPQESERDEKATVNPISKLTDTLKKIKHHERQLDSARAARKSTTALNQELNKAREEFDQLLQDAAGFIRTLNSKLAKAEQENARLRQSLGQVFRELDCRRAGKGEECREATSEDPAGAISIPR